ncbi:MAG: hypothetical protein ABIC91_04220 [Nanoarchaeota archaeon]|nr:hypothetical protein [Nanoarchaeota archaeon]MBU1031292.1 hypothetical protein [Nanoarchaeota archaeon]MBU1849522.1 hypothetical protein [Nanoarchaeota archaeon]
MFFIKECKTKAGFTATPKKRLKLNMDFVRKNFEVLQDAGIVIVLKVDGEEVIVKEYGELTVKTTKDKKKIMSIAKKIYGVK